MRTIQIIVALLVIFTISSCSDEIITSDQVTYELNNDSILIPITAKLSNEKSDKHQAQSGYEEVREFAKLIASSLKNKDVRKFLKDEADKKFDGDYDILVSRVMKSMIKEKRFANMIISCSGKESSMARNIFENAINNPKLNISIPLHLTKWNTRNQQLLVAISYGCIEHETEFLEAYDSNERMYYIDAENEPDVPVIVIGNSERMKYFEAGGNLKTSRISGNREKIVFLKCPNLSAIESWYFGGPELNFKGVVYNDGFSAAFQAFDKTQLPDRALASGGYNPNQGLFYWYFDDTHGPDYWIQSAEIDNWGATQKVTVGVTAGVKGVVSGSAAYELTYKAQDKLLAGEIIHYLNSTPSPISDSYIIFTVINTTY